MKQRRPYAGEITKDYLKKLGIEHVSTDGTIVIKKGEQVNINFNDKAKKSYGLVNFYDPEIRAAVPKEERISNTGNISLGVHVLNYVWNKEDKPSGLVIDHIDNDPRNNDLSNLQMITQSENIAKERTNWHISEIKCNLSKPRSFYETKLANYIAAYEQAKIDKDAKAAHHLRTNVAQTRARLRYYDNHIAEYLAKQDPEHDCHARAQKKRELKADIDSARKFYQDLEKAYGIDDPIVYQYWGEWKMAIVRYKLFCNETKKARAQIS